MEKTKISLITDLHLASEGQIALNVDTRKNFCDVLAKVKEDAPVHIIVAGDICYRQPDIKVYQWARNILDKTGIPYSVVSGNHDDSGLLYEHMELGTDFNKVNNELYYVKLIGGKRFIFLDTAIGEMSETQWSWLSNQLEKKGEGSIIIMHHPPLIVGVPHMDNRYSFRQNDRFQSQLENHPFKIKIFTGHYHVERALEFKNIQVFITPSCFVQIDDRCEEFVPDHYTAGYRNIEIGPDFFATYTRYLM